MLRLGNRTVCRGCSTRVATPMATVCSRGLTLDASRKGEQPAAQRVLTHHRMRLYASYLVVALAVLAGLTGCVRRTIRITTEPPHALVYLNDQEIGRSAVTTDFIWYGDYDVIVRKEGYKTL